MLLSILWDVDPEIFKIGPIAVRWYGLLFALGFLLGYQLVERMFKKEGIPLEWLEKLFMYTLIATVIGARLGHVIFYGWEFYSQHPAEILKIWHGGLASHGATIGILTALYFYSKKVSKKSMLWILDRVAIPVALAGFFIRTGNLMNSEIIGTQTDLAWGFQFVKVLSINGHPVDPLTVRHPAQLYEALCYLFSFGILMYMYWKTNAKEFSGRLIGTFFMLIFTARFFIEFIKENQEAFEEGMSLNMGQWLSIPFILLGGYLTYNSLKKHKA
ncbi:prolipoprotein diacylglyceryl transferase [Ancylomarina euxinus]|uniref:Phosphatidylglycerol--prolipoprotein diacylglyceryl transferase n=1 Tax=Ancylomarina euxinus TaxID=2283627 RepID=A0A425Y486_9BACT|nr:prolipoprotein diacylglyceryl transferase [Ancylomarina euxinus]MCZ4694690.1 prolipoprotein diacylglyceryl transferase [Ancylomarina euxinus]MUP14234.1 prolipoprotein diacylglyceryl transferase [Ancylomarina euxinus]RRG23083.1 prolipoprotein diacylglyceryl transferase [Ancylomarina euxinus]